jgi:hypothetical protein
MNNFTNILCYVGGANLDILKKCPTETNGFIATGVGIINVVLLSIVTMVVLIISKLNINIVFAFIISLFYGFFVFVGYWGVLSVIRKSVKYSSGAKIFCLLSAVLFSFVASNTIELFIIKDYSLLVKPQYSIDKFNYYVITLIIDVIIMLIYLLPIIIKILIKSSNYEEEKEKIELNFIAQKEADIIAYREKYESYAQSFNESSIKIDAIEQLSKVTKEYHLILEKTLKETFDFMDKIAKMTDKNSQLLDNSQEEIVKQFKMILSKMSGIFGEM